LQASFPLASPKVPGGEGDKRHSLAPEMGLTSQYTQGDVVEYFSQTNQHWIRATIKAIMCKEGKGGATEVTYDVRVGKGQTRANVDVHLLRPPLTADEPCDFFDIRNDEWIEAFVSRATPASSTTLGYMIRLHRDKDRSDDVAPGHEEQYEEFEESGSVYVSQNVTIPSVPASRLRRRFPEGALVRLYRSAELGWVNATVHYDEDELIRTRSTQSSPNLRKQKNAFAHIVERHYHYAGNDQFTNRFKDWVARHDGSDVDHWVDVYVQEDGKQPERVHSWHLQFREEYLTQLRSKRVCQIWI